ncbi:MAG TPA: ThuA domain-containing protein, partial [Capillimicrobium sp.]|jgi:type 1 glutamine amidotransferase
VREIGAASGFRVRATEDASVLSRRGLRPFEVVLFLNTTGTILDDDQRAALAAHVRRGGGFMGVHSAADTEHGWPFYARLVGARFLSHPAVQSATFLTEDPDSPATSHLARRFQATDEFYDFDRNPREQVHVLLSIDESTYDESATTAATDDHPMAWCHDVGDGRAFYTALGHEEALYGERWYRRHLLGGIRIAARKLDADCSGPGSRKVRRPRGSL